MRIISGAKRGKKLFTPTDDRVRPTADRAREALFSILEAKFFDSFDGLKVADVFSGTGAVGLEAVSRGAYGALFVDIDLKLTKKNAAICGFENLTFLERDVRRLPLSKEVFDFIFLDAPYNKGLTELALNLLVDKRYAHSKTLIVAEIAVDEMLPRLPLKAEIIEERIYGAAKFLFIKLKAL